MSFKVGDLVEVIGPRLNGRPSVLAGLIGVVVAIHEPFTDSLLNRRTDGVRLNISKKKLVPPERLRLKRPKDDADPRADFTPGEWELCPWKPSTVKA